MFIYVVLTSTPTLVGKALRAFSGKKLNHASISLDADLNRMYSFARKKLCTPFVGGLVKEDYNRLSLGGKFVVYTKIYKIPVSEASYNKIENYINNIMDDGEKYLYNLFAVIGYPFHIGFNVYKSYVCSEFVVRTLSEGNVIVKDFSSFDILPEDIGGLICKNLHFEGSLKDYVSGVNHLCDSDEFFAGESLPQSVIQTAEVVARLSYRCINKKNTANNKK